MSDPLQRSQRDSFTLEEWDPSVASTSEEAYQMPEGLRPKLAAPNKPQDAGFTRWPEWAYLPDQPDRWAVAVAVVIIVLGIFAGLSYGGAL